jgi:hypothetical protein
LPNDCRGEIESPAPEATRFARQTLNDVLASGRSKYPNR